MPLLAPSCGHWPEFQGSYSKQIHCTFQVNSLQDHECVIPQCMIGIPIGYIIENKLLSHKIEYFGIIALFICNHIHRCFLSFMERCKNVHHLRHIHIDMSPLPRKAKSTRGFQPFHFQSVCGPAKMGIRELIGIGANKSLEVAWLSGTHASDVTMLVKRPAQHLLHSVH